METEKKHLLPFPVAGVSGFNLTGRQRKSLRKNPDNGTPVGKITVMETDLNEMAFLFSFEPHPVTFS